MKIYLAKHEPGRMGGGWTFQDNLRKALPDNISGYDKADIYLIASASMVNREEVEKAKSDGKKIILRVDNIIRNSRNRGTGMTRMRDMAQWADLVIYQSMFAKELLNDYLEPKKYKIIINSTDQTIFYPSQFNITDSQTEYLYIRSSSDETKNWEMARSQFQNEADPKRLTIIGKPLDSRIEEYNFDFYMGENVRYIGEISDKNTMAEYYRNSNIFLYSYFNDCCSNTLIEALCCGVLIQNCYGMLDTGGAREIMDLYAEHGYDYFSLKRMGKEYKKALELL